MGNEDLYYFGRILKTHGNKGHFIAHSEIPEISGIPQPEVIFIEIEGDHVPFFTDHFEFLTNNTVMVRFDDLTSPEEGEKFQGRSLFISSSQVPKRKGKKFYKDEITGYRVVDSGQGEIGIIDKVLDFPSQTLLQVTKDQHEILIPVADEFIKKIDRRTKILHVTLPEGLISLNY